MKTQPRIIHNLSRFAAAILLLGLTSCEQIAERIGASGAGEQSGAEQAAASIEGLWAVDLTEDQLQARAKDQASFEANPNPDSRALMRSWDALENTRMSVGPTSFVTTTSKHEPVTQEYKLDRADGKLSIRFAMQHHLEQSYTIVVDDNRGTMDWIDSDGRVHRWKRVDADS